MTRLLRLACWSSVAVVPLCTPALAQPANDTCPAAPALTLNVTANGSTINALSDLPQSPCGFDDAADVWYKFTAPAAGTYVFDVFGVGGLDCTLTVYSACISGLLACNDDFSDGDIDPQVVLNLASAQTVRCRIAANFLDEGGFSIIVSGAGGGTPPANDECSAAGLPVVTVGTPSTGTNTNAGTSVVLNPDACGTFIGSGGGSDVFLSFTPASTGNYAIETCGSNFDTVLSIHTGCPVSDANLLACNDDANVACTNDETNSRIDSVSLTGGQHYLIRVAGYNEGFADTGSYSVLVTSLSAQPTGACCRGGTCSAATQADCTGANSRWAGASTVCNVPGNTTTPCCRGDYNQVGGVTVQDIFDFLIDYFTANAHADVNGVGGVTVQDIFDYLIAYFAGPC
jgi:hypothetical protein